VKEAAAVPEAFITEHDAIRTVGDLTIGKTLLVRGANGGVGQAAVQFGVAAGARVLGAVRSEAAAEVVRSLDAEAIVGDDLVGAVKAVTGGRGVDVALGVVGGQGLADTVRCLARRGRAVVLSLGAGPKVEALRGPGPQPVRAPEAADQSSHRRPATSQPAAMMNRYRAATAIIGCRTGRRPE